LHRLFASAAALAACAAPLAAQDGPRVHPPQPTTAAIRPSDAMTRIYVLADDSMMGRQVGHPGNVMGTRYIASEFQRLGLEPAGTDGFFQAIPLMRKGLAPGAALRVPGGALEAWRDFAPLPQVRGAFAFGTHFAAANTPSVYGGQIGGTLISAEQAAGKVVVLSAPAGANGEPNYRFWTVQRGNPFPGAAAVLVATLDASPGGLIDFLRSTQTELDDGSAPPAGSAGMLVTRAVADRILGRSLSGATAGTAGVPVSGEFDFRRWPVEAPARNVIGILRGSDPALRGQYVVISAHNDHEGFADAPLDHDSVRAYNRVMRPQGVNDEPGTPSSEQWARITALRDSMTRLHGGPRRDSIFNGADDDGSGTVALLEIAESMAAGPRPRRSVLFMSHTGEEAGLLGSKHFTDHPTVPRDSIVAALNMDMVGRGRAEDIRGGGPRYIQLIGSRRLSTQLGATIDSLNSARREPMEIDYSFDAAGHTLNRYCRSDHFMYARYGIPITYFSRGYHVDYHGVGDEPQYIDYEGLARVAGFVGDIALAVANRPERLVVDGTRQDPNAPCRQ
jgi:hypothetical protein